MIYFKTAMISFGLVFLVPPVFFYLLYFWCWTNKFIKIFLAAAIGALLINQGISYYICEIDLLNAIIQGKSDESKHPGLLISAIALAIIGSCA